MAKKNKQDIQKQLENSKKTRDELEEKLKSFSSQLKEDFPNEVSRIRELVSKARETSKDLDVNNPEHKEKMDMIAHELTEELEKFKIQCQSMSVQHKGIKLMQSKLAHTKEISDRFLAAVAALQQYQLDNKKFVTETDEKLKERAKQKALESKEKADRLRDFAEQSKAALQRGEDLPSKP